MRTTYRQAPRTNTENHTEWAGDAVASRRIFSISLPTRCTPACTVLCIAFSVPALVSTASSWPSKIDNMRCAVFRSASIFLFTRAPEITWKESCSRNQKDQTKDYIRQSKMTHFTLPVQVVDARLDYSLRKTSAQTHTARQTYGSVRVCLDLTIELLNGGMS